MANADGAEEKVKEALAIPLSVVVSMSKNGPNSSLQSVFYPRLGPLSNSPR